MTAPHSGENMRWNTVLARKAKVLFVATPKVACTSLKWALATAEGTLSTGISGTPEPTIDLTIHDFSVHGMGVLGLVDEAERVEAFTSPDWIRFCVTRPPVRTAGERVVEPGGLRHAERAQPGPLCPVRQRARLRGGVPPIREETC